MGEINRIIKFRAWDANAKKFYDPIFYLGEWYRTGRSFEDGCPCNDTIMQFTGVKDAIGRDIYEGDILKYRYHRDQSGTDVVEYTEPVEWDYTTNVCGWGIKKNHTPYIIGNIYEHPNLLK